MTCIPSRARVSAAFGGWRGHGMASEEAVLRRSVKGLSETEFRERLGTEEACRAALFEMRWRDGLTCPACGHRGFRRLRHRAMVPRDRRARAAPAAPRRA